ncbi:NAD-glutamate dehydrogenase [Aromatoleum petrolei]|uniref:NAD-glutamate dehydrogenase n=1 Tax=Aromatoleum petrolei TaxID=76116 RepID=A0ABX1MSS6_9RHOO|nr:NAD-glutamate dehydrogenase [Aromatoleum petrolei]NMF90291.1 NAD-glutamate dehydrogenase [Aromatoleum petrolei]QTQ37108.1 NAD-glutamate dehydrogenase [Aromatoleum petrolei]
MQTRHAESGAASFEAILEQIQLKLPSDQATLVGDFARCWFGQVAPEDIADYTVDDLYGAVLSHWHFARKHRGGTRLRVYNPKLEEHGWESTHSVIEIVNDDMPFLVDSIAMEVNRQGLTLHLIVHPVMRIVRDVEGVYQGVADDAGAGRYESIIHVEVDRRTDAGDLEALRAGLERVLADVRVAVADWPAMQQRVADISAEIEHNPPPVPAEEIEESVAFLRWLMDDNLVLLGCRDYELAAADGGTPELSIVAGSGLGLLREMEGDKRSRSFGALPAELKTTLPNLPVLLTVTKSNTRSTVHRVGYIDRFSIKRFDADGHVCGERRVIGLLASTAYSASPKLIPFLRRKVDAVIARAGLMPKSHAAKALLTILERYPRDELFQIDPEELYHQAMGILHLGERQRTRLFVRCDPFARFVACLIYVPREHYNTDQRLRMQAVLMEAFNGASSDFDVQFFESALARVLIIVRTRDSVIPPFEVHELEQRIVRATRRWEDELQRVLLEHCGEERGMALLRRYGSAFPAGYREEYSPRMAVFDIEQMESVAADGLAMSLYIPLEAPAGRLNFKIYRAGAPVPLSQSLPMLERMGVKVIDERPSEIARQDGEWVWIHDFGLAYAGAEELDIDTLRPLFHDAFLRAWRGETESDDFSRLTLLAGLTWREISVLRAYAKHMKQAAFTFSQAYMQQTLAAHPRLARQLIELFALRLDPARSEERVRHEATVLAGIDDALNDVANLDEDRILRQFLAMVRATLRTNYYQRGADGTFKPYLSFKFDPKRIPNLPQPMPMYEIFVYAPRFEGVHLRGGKVARGGLRWSDRMEDYRTEVLGLVKAQIVKNAVIVPVGSKGGFVVKNPPPAGDREAVLAEGIACYRLYLHGLLDLTDNLVQGRVVPPPHVVRHDGDDPYLVVAADKGTASFSDYANAVAAEYGFWLGDAFASGGSAGYDHKKMAITARGAWESVKRHFRELGIDTQEQPFTAVGVGDMSGDVFGNGMLRSRKTRLVAAFDHRHVFIDPDPDPEASFVERERLFALPRSSWNDYDRTKISAGGGVWPRSAKSIALSPQMQAVLGVEAESLTPSELIRAILRAPVDLLYNGGIGTYVKATNETDASVGDRANDAVRVNGAELRCRVIGEGGNLGMTQLGRIEYALKGGKLYTDAIDNSGGVDCSDHEVNIKILLNSVIAEGELTGKQRDALLAEMTDEVAALVLRDNYAQTQVLSVTRARGVALLDEQAEFIRRLSFAGRLNRKLEFLPLDDEIAERAAARTGLVTPELAVLLAYSKIELYDEVLASDVPEDPYIGSALSRYFPAPLRERFAAHIAKHPLRREIISTHVINSMINRVGPTFVSRLQGEVGATPAEIVRAYMATREIFGLVPIWRAIEELDNRVDDAVQTAMITDCGRLVQRGTTWFLRHREWLADLQATLARFGPGVKALSEHLYRLVSDDYRAQLDVVTARYVERGAPGELALRIALLDELYSALDLVEIVADTGRPEGTVAAVYFTLGGHLDLYWLGAQIAALPADTRWQNLARGALRVDLSTLARSLAAEILKASPDLGQPDDLIAAWEERRMPQIERYRHLLADVKMAQAIEMSMLSVLLRELRGMV